jgi:hypothetical protein
VRFRFQEESDMRNVPRQKSEIMRLRPGHAHLPLLATHEDIEARWAALPLYAESHGVDWSIVEDEIDQRLDAGESIGYDDWLETIEHHAEAREER